MKTVNNAISVNITSKNRGYFISKNTNEGVSWTDRIATSVPVLAIATPIAIAAHPSVIWSFRFRNAINSDCAKKSTNQAAIDTPCTSTSRKIPRSIGLPSKCVPCV